MSRGISRSHTISAGLAVWTAVAVTLVISLGAFAWGRVESARAAFPGANGRLVFASRADLRYEIYTMAADGKDRRRVTFGENPKYSRGGTRIAFIRNHDVFVMNFDGTGIRQLTKGPEVEINPSWSPDDKRIAFARRVGGKFDIYVVSVDGSVEELNLTRSDAMDERGPAWSPDGKRIAYERDGHIRVMGFAGKSSRTLTDKGTNVSPAWSPDGKTIAFAAKLTADGNWEIYVMSVDGTNVRPLAPHPDIDLDPAWSPDGKYIVFTSSRGKSYDIHVMKADGSDVTQLTQGPAEDTTADWQPVDQGPIDGGVLRIVTCQGVVGTGFIVAPRLVVTADHVVVERGRAARRIVLENGTKQVGTAIVVGRDPISDLALLRTSKRVRGHVFRFAVSTPKKDDKVVVHGYPEGAGRVMREGRIESRGQTTVGSDNVRRSGLIQIAVEATEGMSGGPLVRGDEDTNGEAGHVLGVVIQIRDTGNIAFAVPGRVVEAKVPMWLTTSRTPPVGC